MRHLILVIFILSITLYGKDYTKNKETRDFIETMSKKHNFSKSYLNHLFSDVTFQKTPLKLYGGLKKEQRKNNITKKKKIWHGSWDRYVKHKVTSKHIAKGLSFINKYHSTFKKVEKEYGVPTEYIAAIIGIETIYGKYVGNFPVFDTLTTLSFEKNRRSNFFKEELEEFILLTYRANLDPKNLKGSYAGAIGLGQFMPSSYTRYGVDFNQDGEVNMLHPQDVIASVANYLDKHGWETDEEVATRVSYKGKRFQKYKTGFRTKYDRKILKGIQPKNGTWNYYDKVRLIKLSKKRYDELWYGANNFYVITRYNNSSYYAMSVHKLAQKIKEKLHIESNALASNQINSHIPTPNEDIIE